MSWGSPGCRPGGSDRGRRCRASPKVGRISPVPPAVWAYDVGGMKIVDHWFDYRKAEPGGRKSSPLDEIQPAEWPHEWNTELLQLLTVLRRLTDLEPRQADLLLDQILDGPLLLLGDLTGVFPVDKRDRTPRLSLHDADAEAGGLLL